MEKEPRFAVITWEDTIIFDSDDVSECYDIYEMWGKELMRGVYDYEQCKYLDLVDIIDITGVQIHSGD